MSFFPQRTHEDFGTTGNIPMALNSTFEYENKFGLATIVFKLIPPTGGEVEFEGLSNTNSWFSVTLRSMDRDAYVYKSSQEEHLIGSISGLKKFRIRVTTAGTIDGSITGRAAQQVSTLEGVEFANPPHKIGLKIITKVIEFSTQQTNTIIWAPTADTKFAITNLKIHAFGPTDGNITIFEDTNIPANWISKGYYDVTLNNSIIDTQNFQVPIIAQNYNTSLKVTTDSGIDCVITVHGYEIE